MSSSGIAEGEAGCWSARACSSRCCARTRSAPTRAAVSSMRTSRHWADAGVFRMTVARHFGGYESSLLTSQTTFSSEPQCRADLAGHSRVENEP